MYQHKENFNQKFKFFELRIKIQKDPFQSLLYSFTKCRIRKINLGKLIAHFRFLLYEPQRGEKRKILLF